MRGAISIVMCMMMTVSAFTVICDDDAGVDGAPDGGNHTSYISSFPFRIESDADFATYANGGGDGSAGNPWIIENYDIDGDGAGFCIYIGNTTEYFIVRDCYLHDASLWMPTFPYYWRQGLALCNVSHGTVINITASSNDGYGISLYSSNNVTVENNTVSDGGGGIEVWTDCVFNTLRDNNITNCGQGIELYWFSDNNIVENNTISWCQSSGIYLSDSNNNAISDNDISFCRPGISFSSSTDCVLTGNAMQLCGIMMGGMWWQHWDSHQIDATNTVNGKPVRYLSGQSGTTVPTGAGQVILAGCNNVVVEGQMLNSCTAGIQLGFSSSNLLANNSVFDQEYGIYLFQSDSNVLLDNSVSWSNTCGAFLYGSEYCNLVNNSFSSGLYGIELRWDSHHVNLTGNQVFSNEYGIQFLNSKSATLHDNALTGNGIYIIGYDVNHWNSHYIDATNTVGGKPVRYVADSTGGTVPPGAGQVILANCTNVLVENQDISDATTGILMGYSSNNTLRNNTMTANSQDGILLQLCDNNTMVNNTCSNNTFGVHLRESNWNEMADGLYYSNTERAIYLDYHCYNNTVHNNTVRDNYIAFTVMTSYGNFIHHNNFINNTNQAYDWDTNFWDDGYPSGGNYWSVYAGVDNFSGPLQDVPGSDGFGDTPYNIFGGAQDRYPLMATGNPTVVSTQPQNGAVDVPVGTNVAVVFSESMNVSYEPVLAQVAGTAATYTFAGWSATNKANDTATWIHGNWAQNDAVGLRVSGFRDLDNLTGSAYTWSFGTEDTIPPASSVDAISQYWHCVSPTTVAATAADASGIGFVELWHRFSPDNGTTPWTAWAKFGNDTVAPYRFDFTYPNGEGFYEYCSRAGDVPGNYEAAPATSDRTAGYDATAPVSSATAISPATTTEAALAIDHADSDALSGVDNVTLWYSFSPIGGSYGPWERHVNESDRPAFGNFSFDFPDGVGYYRFYTRATDLSGNWEDAPAGNDTWVLKLLPDNTAPVSSVNGISPYWIETSTLSVSATASDADSGVANVTLWYRWSPDNDTWSAWTRFGRDAGAPWQWTFDFPRGGGSYEFRSVANDTANNTEAAPTDADACCGRDLIPPEIDDDTAASCTTGETCTFAANVADDLELAAVHVIYGFGTGSETNGTMTHTHAGTHELDLGIPPNSLETLHYRIAAVDRAGNWNSTPWADIVIIDNDLPVAIAGDDLATEIGIPVTFNGSASADNIGIANYSWTFTQNGTAVALWGAAPRFTFWSIGNYTVTLTVADAAGNTGADTLDVAVEPVQVEPVSDADGDGVPDDQDAFPQDPDEWTDTDGDGIGNNADPDDDGDGVPDADDPDPLDPTVTGEGGIGDYWWLILIIIAVAAAAVLLGYKMRSGKRPPDEKSEAVEETEGKPNEQHLEETDGTG